MRALDLVDPNLAGELKMYPGRRAYQKAHIMRNAHINSTTGEMVERFGVTDVHDRVSSEGLELTRSRPHLSLGWGNQVLGIVSSTRNPHRRVLTAFHWGFNPVKHNLGAARIETASINGTWAESYAHRRCLMPITIGQEHPQLVGAGALYNPAGTCLAMLTAPSQIGLLHRPSGSVQRSPLLIPSSMWDMWLSPFEERPDEFIEQILLLSVMEKVGARSN